MPSSSNHNTLFERRIQSLFRRTYIYLVAANQEHRAAICLDKFAIVLDVDPIHLYLSVTSRPPDDTNPPKRLKETSEIEEVQAEAARFDNPDKIWLAGGFLAEVCHSLNKVARVQEAARWYSWGHELQMIGERMADVARSRAYGGPPVDEPMGITYY